jgi:hypothetical protein
MVEVKEPELEPSLGGMVRVIGRQRSDPFDASSSMQRSVASATATGRLGVLASLRLPYGERTRPLGPEELSVVLLLGVVALLVVIHRALLAIELGRP